MCELVASFFCPLLLWHYHGSMSTQPHCSFHSSFYLHTIPASDHHLYHEQIFLWGSLSPHHFWEPKILENFIIFWMQGYHISFFLFCQAGFKYETRNDEIFTQVNKLIDKNIALFFILLCLMCVVILLWHVMWYMIDV